MTASAIRRRSQKSHRVIKVARTLQQRVSGVILTWFVRVHTPRPREERVRSPRRVVDIRQTRRRRVLDNGGRFAVCDEFRTVPQSNRVHHEHGCEQTSAGEGRFPNLLCSVALRSAQISFESIRRHVLVIERVRHADGADCLGGHRTRALVLLISLLLILNRLDEKVRREAK